MSLFDSFGGRPLAFDGAMGTMLQSLGLGAGKLPESMNGENESAVISVHNAYIDAGADVISSNSFSCNKAKLEPLGLDSYDETYRAVALARRAADSADRRILVAADFGPTGRLMPPLGDMSFDEAVDAYADSLRAAEDAGADLIFFETMSDLYECKAAVIAARENTSLPVAVSLTFDESGRTLTGADPETVATYLSSLGVDAIGVNCGLGPDAMEPIAESLVRCSGLPVIVNANAGLPKIDSEGNTYFDVLPERFYKFAKTLASFGVSAVGGCCGTSPEYIDRVSSALADEKIISVCEKLPVAVCSGNMTYRFGGKTAVIGERLNPTGKPLLKTALRESNYDFLCAEAVAQESVGADILDLNVGLPEIDEKSVLPRAVEAIRSVSSLPIQLDSADPEALEIAARQMNGIPILNSVNGKEESLSTVLPILKKYGGLAVALLLDESGIPDSPEGRLAIADRIIERAESMGISRDRLIFDSLTMTVATDGHSGDKTLACVEALTKRGLKTVLGVSNISFGMPDRERINASFLSAAIARGLSAAIINPASDTSRAVLDDPSPSREFTFDLELPEEKKSNDSKEITLFDAVFAGLTAKASECAKKLLETKKPLDIIESELIPALNALGDGFEKKRIFLPRLLGGASAAKSAFDAVNSAMAKGDREKGMKIVIATVKGDIHDIGKNIVSTLLSNYGFDVIDLGKDVPPERVVDETERLGAPLVGLSALMTTTVPAMTETVRLLKERLPNVKVMVGGAVLTEEYAETMGADFYGEDAMASVRYAQELELFVR